MAKQIVTFEASDGRVFKTEKDADLHEASIVITEVMMESGVDFDTVLQVSDIFLKNAEKLGKALAPFSGVVVASQQPMVPKTAEISHTEPSLEMSPETSAPESGPSASSPSRTSNGVPVVQGKAPGGREWGQVPKTMHGKGPGTIGKVSSVNIGDGSYITEDGSVARMVG